MFENCREIDPDDRANRIEIAEKADSLELRIGDAWGLGVTVELQSTGDGTANVRWSSAFKDENGKSEVKLDAANLLSGLEIASWEPRYDKPNVLDGMTWSVRIGEGDAFFKCSGCNAWPSGLESLVNALQPYVPGSIGAKMKQQLR
jgi:hypothetical protein